MTDQPRNPSAAIVARLCPERRSRLVYLRNLPNGGNLWVDSVGEANAYPSLRAATLEASRLPEELKAFGLESRIALVSPK